jgi:Domain of unknown function (DUF4279)
VSGDRLDPDIISDIFGVRPTIAYRKGERYHAGARSGGLLGRTGVWLLSTKGLVFGLSPTEHLSYLTRFLEGAPRLAAFRQLMERDGLKADASLFWHGSAGAQEPEIPHDIEQVFDAIPAHLERDFDRD